MLNSSLADIIASRRSTGPKYQTGEAPSDALLERAARAARSAPAHGLVFPVRFVKIASRDRLADLFESALPPDADAALRERARGKALKGACCVALIGPKPAACETECMTRENLMTAGGALTNFLNVLWAEGVAAKTVSAHEFRDPRGLFDPKSERLLCFVLCGMPAAPMTPRGGERPILSVW